MSSSEQDATSQEVLVRFLHARLQEDEERAQAATPGPWTQSGIGDYGWTVSFSRPGSGVETADSDQGRADADFIAAHSPDLVLAEVAAKRRILDEVVPRLNEMDDQLEAEFGTPSSPGPYESDGLLRLLALPYADHPAYQEAWRP